MIEYNFFSKKSRIFIYCIMILILLSLLVTASYTWFSLSRTPRVSNIGLYINAPTGLLLSKAPEGEEWVLQLDYRELVDETAPLRPVTWSDQEQRFYAAVYGIDGRQTGRWEPLSDSNNANRDDVYGYYVKATFYATTDTSVNISLTHAVAVSEGIDGAGTFLIGTPVWDYDNLVHTDGGLGAQTAIRIGFRITPMQDGEAQADQAKFVIYEPNCDSHVDGSEGYVPTPSIDGGEHLVSPDRLITQSTTTWTEAEIVQRDVVVKNMGQFLQEPFLYFLEANQMIRIDIYIWLEGQDVDCNNKLGQTAEIMASIQFDADESGMSGLDPIPKD